jgi:hypothetical protein
MSEDYYDKTRREMAEVLIGLRDLADNYTEADDLVGRIIRGTPLSDVDEQRREVYGQVQKLREKLWELLKVSAVWTYAESMRLQKISDYSFWWIENLTFDRDYVDEFSWRDTEKSLLVVSTINDTLSATDNLTKTKLRFE